ncbi:MAG TPA: outer membrane protein assembly factor BamD [Woeseiaceae bacterium]|nr:outer membrane protein assembly factor BamD [Woeseiaceae bacterium]
MNITGQPPIKSLTILCRWRPHVLLLVAVLSLFSACAGDEETYSEVQNLSEAYAKARDSIARGNYRRGIQIFEAMQARYPFSDLSRQVQLELIYAYYKSGEPERAIDAADTFIRENPINERVDYALYIKALAYFEGDPGFLERWFRRDMTKRPPEGVDQSYATLRRLVERYPASPYAEDAAQRMVFLKNRLADYENHVAEYYMRRGAYVAAVKRATNALEEFNGADSNAESLQILASAYDKLGLTELAEDARRVLATNFPDKTS